MTKAFTKGGLFSRIRGHSKHSETQADKSEAESVRISITCPSCQHHWYRRPTIHEEITAFANKPTLKGMMYILDKRCSLCGLKFKSPDEATLDHIVPKSKNGKNHWSNYQLAHSHCNAKKGNKLTSGIDLRLDDPESKVKA